MEKHWIRHLPLGIPWCAFSNHSWPFRHGSIPQRVEAVASTSQFVALVLLVASAVLSTLMFGCMWRSFYRSMNKADQSDSPRDMKRARTKFEIIHVWIPIAQIALFAVTLGGLQTVTRTDEESIQFEAAESSILGSISGW